ncbi:fatty acyl-CoA reductase wat-like [Vespula maculifrons]|uniref:Fatty acyl-CoA reductase wat-like n=1 Tax=Vespula maculifrons TaxID=7453 RepID=A0ABD2CX44_VESMC
MPRVGINDYKNLLTKGLTFINSFEHEYTIYADCLHNPIQKKFYYLSMDIDKLMNSMDEK